MVKLSFILVNYNVKDFLNTAINSIKKSTGEIPNEIIVVDNASEDGSVEYISKSHPDVLIIANKDNKGFGKANNQALEIAKGEFLVIINPDTVVSEDTFHKLIKFFNIHPDAGMAGCKVLNPDGSLQLACRRSFPGPWVSLTRVTGLSRLFPKSKLLAKYNLTYLDENETYEVDAISGAFMMLKREVYEKIGGFDPIFFMYGEDLDLCYRTQSAGYKVYYVHTTEIIHFKGESTKRSSLDEAKVFYEAMHLFVKKHFSSSFLVEAILRMAIIARHFLAFLANQKLILTAVLFDFFIFGGAIYLAEQIYRPGNWAGIPDFAKPWIYILPGAFQIGVAALTGSYKKNSISNLKISLSIIIGFLLLSAFTFFFKQFAFSRALLLIIYAISLASFTIWRIVFKIIFREKLSEISRRNKVLIIGTSEKAVQFASKLKQNLTNIQQVIGLIGLSTKNIGEKFSGFEVLGTLETLNKVITEYQIHKVIFLSDEISFKEMFSVVSKYNDSDVDFVIAGSEHDFIVGKSAISMVDNIPLLKLHYNISSPVNKFIKRTTDIFLSILILIFISPFVYFSAPFRKVKSEFVNFISGVPNVLIGRKSFVGPTEDAAYSGLYLGKPGLTGLWFTEMFDKNDIDELNKLNIFYARNQNIWLDMEIIGKTFSKFFFN